VRALAEADADVIVSSRKADASEEAAGEVRRLGRRALGHACHMADWDAIDRLVEAAYGAFERVDILVNKAGNSPLYDTPEDITEDRWDKTLGVNLKGPFRLTALVGARMRAHRGSIVNVSSIGAIRSTGDTDISANWNHEAFAERASTFPSRRAGEVEEAVGAIHYFASDAASFTTGAVLAVDGGAQWSLAGGGAQAERFNGSLFKGRP
jgi:NAD(P)-dependent dehydrogenase (short-subunit alcohol dehydrogenase family)